MRLFAIKNLSSGETFPVEVGQLHKQRARPPFASPDEYRKWKVQRSTVHTFFSAVEARDPGHRITKENPPRVIHGLVADWDCELQDWDSLARGLSTVDPDLMPTWASRTFSGGFRAVWEFEQPVNVFNHALAAKFMSLMASRVGVDGILPSWDAGAWSNLFQYYELGTDWQSIRGAKAISASVTGAALAEAAKDTTKGWEVDGQIPIEEIAKEVQSRWPGAWPGEFEIGSRGPRFWDPSASNETAAIVKEDGILFFTDGGGWKNWAQLLGRSFVEKYEADRTGRIINDLWTDGKQYYTPNEVDEGVNWNVHTASTLTRYLQRKYGLSNHSTKGQLSEAGAILAAIEDLKRCDGVLPFVYDRDKVVHFDNMRLLNNSRVRVIDPLPPLADGTKVDWGDGFPHLAGWLDGLLVDRDQFDRLISWMHVMYRHAYQGKPHNGQNLILVGKGGTGKTLLSTKVIGDLMGGSFSALKLMTGEDKFNDSAYHKGVWTVDDGEASGGWGARESFANALKVMAANEEFSVRGMYQSARTIPWKGRVVVTANEDPKSLEILPTLESTNEDKLLILRIHPERKFVFPDRMGDLIKPELPAFARWLLEWQIPGHLVGDSRWITVPFCDPWVKDQLEGKSQYAGIIERVEDWVADQFRESQEDEIFATNTMIYDSMKAADSRPDFKQGQLGHALNHLLSIGAKWLRRGDKRLEGIATARKGYFFKRP